MIDKIIMSLNELEVKGKKNMDILLGCILALEHLKEDLNKNTEGEDDGR